MNETAESQDRQFLIERVERAVDAGDHGGVRGIFAGLHPSEAADLLESLPVALREQVWPLVPAERVGDVLSHARDSVRADLLESMSPRAIAAATAHLDTDDAADIVQDLPDARVAEVLLALDELRRERLTAVLGYPEDTAGGLMNLDATTVRPDVSIDAVLRYLRRRDPLAERTDCLFVVDRQQRFQATLPLTVVVNADPRMRVAQLMDGSITALPADTPAAEVARLFEQRDLVSAPVVDASGRLLGRITIDDVVDVIREQGEHSLMGLAGLDEADDMFAPVARSARRRALWLGINLVTAFLAAWVIGRFEATIQSIVAVAILMPIVASMGGIAGSQTLTIVIRGLALGQVGSANARALLYKELAVAAINGALWAAAVGLIAGLWFTDWILGAVIALALVVNLLTAALAGTVIPLMLERIGIDPAIAGSVVLTTVTDVVGFAAFLGTATLILL